MTDPAELDRQLRLALMMLSELAPGSVCLDSACSSGLPPPHMANDGGPHPHPYGTRPPWSVAAIRQVRAATRHVIRRIR